MALFFSKSRSANTRMSRATLRSMLDLDSAILADIGLTRADIAEALYQGGSSAGRMLEARRAERAGAWRS